MMFEGFWIIGSVELWFLVDGVKNRTGFLEHLVLEGLGELVIHDFVFTVLFDLLALLFLVRGRDMRN